MIQKFGDVAAGTEHFVVPLTRFRVGVELSFIVERRRAIGLVPGSTI
jgi:hypothetical protein